MVRRLFKLKVRPTAMKLLLWALLIFAFVDTLSRFNVLDITELFGTLTPIFFASFVLIDQGFMTRGRKMGALNWVLAILALAVLLGVFLQVISASLGNTFSGFIGVANSFLIVAVLVSLFTE